MKITCPELEIDYETTHKVYFWIQHGISIVSVPFNIFVLYCILFRSQNQQKLYKCFLFVHQLSAFGANIWINVFWQPNVYLPFLIFRSFGPAAKYLNWIELFTIAFIFVACELLTAMYLFFSRYLILKGFKGLPLKWVWLVAATFVVLAISFYFIWRIEPNAADSLSYLQSKYSCIHDNILEIPNLLVVDVKDVQVMILPAILDVTFLIFFIAFFLTGSVRILSKGALSASSKRKQSKFLLQAALLLIFPSLTIAVPLVIILVIIFVESFGFTWLSDLFFAAGSTYDIGTGLILIAMNPNYLRSAKRTSLVFFSKQSHP